MLFIFLSQSKVSVLVVKIASRSENGKKNEDLNTQIHNKNNYNLQQYKYFRGSFPYEKCDISLENDTMYIQLFWGVNY